MYVTNTGALTIGGIGATDGLSATNAAIHVSSTSSLTVAESIASGGGHVNLSSMGHLTVNTGTTVDSGSGSNTLAADVTGAGAGDDGTGTLAINGTAKVYGATINLRGADVDISATANVGASSASNVVTEPYISTGLNRPWGMALDSSGNLYVANNNPNTVSKYNSSGSLINSSYISGLNSPTGLAFDTSGNLYVANSRSLSNDTTFDSRDDYVSKLKRTIPSHNRKLRRDVGNMCDQFCSNCQTLNSKRRSLTRMNSCSPSRGGWARNSRPALYGAVGSRTGQAHSR